MSHSPSQQSKEKKVYVYLLHKEGLSYAGNFLFLETKKKLKFC